MSADISKSAPFLQVACNCVTTAKWRPTHGFPGAVVVRSREFAGSIVAADDQIVTVDCRVDAIIRMNYEPVPVLAGQTYDYKFFDNEIDDLGIGLIVEVGECPVPYYPNPGETWKIAREVDRGNVVVVMEKVCP